MNISNFSGMIETDYNHIFENIKTFWPVNMASNALRAVIGKTAPHFKAQAWNYRADKFEELSLDSFKNKWLLLFFYPLDFTFVCPTEIIDFSKKAK